MHVNRKRVSHQCLISFFLRSCGSKSHANHPLIIVLTDDLLQKEYVRQHGPVQTHHMASQTVAERHVRAGIVRKKREAYVVKGNRGKWKNYVETNEEKWNK